MLTPEGEELLRKLWYNPKTGLSSMRSLYYIAKPDLPELRMKDVEEWVRKQETYQLHKPTHEPRQVAAILPTGPHQIVQMDLIDLSGLKSPQNRQVSFILTAYDTFSKRLYCIPMTSKSEEDSIEAVSDLIGQMKRRPKVLMSDNGLEFKNEAMAEMLRELGIKQIFSRPGNPRSNGMVERANGTIKRLLFKFLTATESKKYIEALPDFVDQYNSTPHSVTKLAPYDVEELPRGSEELKEIRERMKAAAKKRGTPVKNEGLEVGDEVRVVLPKKKLEKSYTKNYTDYTLPIVKVLHSRQPWAPDRYKLGDEHVYYAEELESVTDIQTPKRKPRAAPAPAPPLREPRREEPAPRMERPKREVSAEPRKEVGPEQTRNIQAGRRYQGRETGIYTKPQYSEFMATLKPKKK